MLLSMPGERRWRTLEWLALAPPVLVAILVWVFGSDVPYWDEWSLAPFLAKAKAGSASVADFFAPHNEHPFALPKAILTGVALATGWNVRIQLLVNVAVVCVTLALLMILGRRAAPGRERALAIFGSSLALFSLAQYENWLWGWQAGFFVSIALIVGAVAILGVARWPVALRIAAAALLCAIATFSIGFGVVSWIALAPAVALMRVEPAETRGRWDTRTTPYLIVWVVLGAVCTAGVMSLGATGSLAPARAGDLVLFFLAVAGTQWTSLAILAATLGLLSIALFAVLAIRALRADAAFAVPWIAIGLVAVGFAALAALARAGERWEIGVSPRYATPMVLLTIATLHLAGSFRAPRTKFSIAAVLVVLLLFANLSFVPPFLSVAEARHVSRVCTDLTYLLEPYDVACFPESALDTRFREWIEIAREKDLRKFADATWFSDLEPSRSIEAGWFPAPVLVTQGAAREPVALVWADRKGDWSLNLPAGAAELWTVPRNQKQLVPIAPGGRVSTPEGQPLSKGPDVPP